MPSQLKTAFLVVGPESSGTRFWMENLIACGCHGSSEHEQPWDHQTPDDDLIAWRRSFPHGGEWPSLSSMIAGLRGQNYAVQAYVTTREWHATALSQVEHRHVGSYAQALTQIRRAVAEIANALQNLDVPWLMIHYEALNSRDYIWAMLEEFDLHFQSPAPQFSNQNDKYYRSPLLCGSDVL